MMAAMMMMMMMKVSPAFVSQQDEEQAAEDAGEAAVNADQQGRRGPIRPTAVTAGTSCWRQTQTITFNWSHWFQLRCQPVRQWSRVTLKLLPSAASPPSDRDTRRRVDGPSPFPLKATSWIS